MIEAALLFLSALIAGIEPFLPFGSGVVAWASVVAVKRQDWLSLGAVLAMGMVRDVLLVHALGVSSMITLAVWTFSTLAVSRFDRLFLVATAGSVLGSVMLSAVEKQPLFFGAIVSAALSVVFLGAWGRLSSNRDITVRAG